MTGINLGSILIAFVGAVILLLVLRLVHEKKIKRT